MFATEFAPQMSLAFLPRDVSVAPASCAVKPIVPFDEAAYPKEAHCRIAGERQWTAHVIDAAKFERFPLNSTGSRDTIT